MTEDELFERAREVNFAYKAPVVGLQLLLHDGDWRIWEYGDTPKPCGDGRYKFEMARATPEGWKISGTPSETAQLVARWLHENGWTNIKTRGYAGEIADLVVEAEYPESYIDRLVVDISPGEMFDSVNVTATSACEPGAWLAIVRKQLPGFAENDSVELKNERVSERPTAPLSFGFNDDGTPRFWDTPA